MECRGTVRSWYANEKVLRVSPELDDGGPGTMSELYFSSCANHETSVICPRCQRDTSHRTQVRMMTAPNVLAIRVRRQEGARVPVAVEQQLDLPGFPVMELVGVVYHNGRDFHSGHYTCLCRGPGGRFWSYDDTKPVHREDREISHIKPKQVVLVVYARSDGAAVWAQPAPEPAEPAAVGIDEAVEVLQAEPQAVACSVGFGTPRRLRRKSSCDVFSPGQGVANMAASTPTQELVACLAPSPPSRRLSRKTSGAEASLPAPSAPASPPVPNMKRSFDEACAASPGATLASPSSRRLRRKISAEEAASVSSPAAALLSPGSRSLRRQNSAEDAVPMASASLTGARVGDAPTQPAQGRGVGMLRRGRGLGRQTASEDRGRDVGARTQGDAANWFLAAADLDGSAGVAQRSMGFTQSEPVPARRRGVVSGFGAERTEDAFGDRERRDREAMTRARVRREDGLRGQARDFQGNDLDRSAGSAWSLGRR